MENNRSIKSQDIISVVISAYNSERTIGNTLGSLEKQDLDKRLYEVIIVDDGSRTDATKNIVEEFIKRGIMQVYYFYQKNEGVGIARNHGISQSVGKILAFTDADCICDHDWLTVIYDNLVVKKKKFIGGYTYSDDTVIFPWKMAPVGQSGITANLAVDFTLVDGVLFDSGFTGMLGDDTDFVIRMGNDGMPLSTIPQMRVLHPPNTIGLDRIIIRSRGRQNEVGLYQKHREKVLSSFSYIFRPILFSRISPFAILSIISFVLIIGLYLSMGLMSVLGVFGLFVIAFHLYLYRYLVIYNPDGRIIPMKDRLRTFVALLVVTPLFFYYRIVGMIKFRFFML